MTANHLEELLETFRKELPPLLSRREAARAAKLSVGGLANMDSKKVGPPRLMLGQRAVYPRGPFLEWLRARVTPVKTGECR